MRMRVMRGLTPTYPNHFIAQPQTLLLTRLRLLSEDPPFEVASIRKLAVDRITMGGQDAPALLRVLVPLAPFHHSVQLLLQIKLDVQDEVLQLPFPRFSRHGLASDL